MIKAERPTSIKDERPTSIKEERPPVAAVDAAEADASRSGMKDERPAVLPTSLSLAAICKTEGLRRSRRLSSLASSGAISDEELWPPGSRGGAAKAAASGSSCCSGSALPVSASASAAALCKVEQRGTPPDALPPAASRAAFESSLALAAMPMPMPDLEQCAEQAERERSECDQQSRNRQRSTTPTPTESPNPAAAEVATPMRCLTCPKASCEQSFLSYYLLQKHLVKSHGADCLVCSVCDKRLSQYYLVSLHIKRLHDVNMRILLHCTLPGCSRTFKSEHALKVHLDAHKKGALACCDVCGLSFARKATLRAHMEKVHDVALPYTRAVSSATRKTKKCPCPECDHTFPHWRTLAKHRRDKHGVDVSDQLGHQRRFQCDEAGCDRSFALRSRLRLHIEVQHSDRDFPCDECDKRFSRESGLLQHKMLLHGEKTLPCPKCDEKFAHSRYLSKHLRAVHSKRCPECPKVFVPGVGGVDVDAAILRHQMRAHMRRKDCSVCAVAFKTYSELEEHAQEHHPNEKIFACLKCDESFARDSALVRHVERRHVDTKFPCERCPAIFEAKGDLLRHLNTSHSGREFKCDQCSKTFSVKARLTRHTKALHTARPYKCEVASCGKVLSSEWQLASHMRVVHTERDKPRERYECDRPQCDKTFASKKSLTKHVRLIHDGIVPFACPEAGCSFGTKSRHELAPHIAAKHHNLKLFVCEICNGSDPPTSATADRSTLTSAPTSTATNRSARASASTPTSATIDSSAPASASTSTVTDRSAPASASTPTSTTTSAATDAPGKSTSSTSSTKRRQMRTGRFTHKAAFVSHMKKVHGVVDYVFQLKCMQCAASFTSRYSLRSHVLDTHGHDSISRCEAPACAEMFFTALDKELHKFLCGLSVNTSHSV